MFKKHIIVGIILFSFFVVYSEDIAPSEEQSISLTAEEGYGYIKINWELQGIPEYDILELKILDRIENEEEVINITDKTGYVLDRDFLKDGEGNYKEISFWIVATIELKKKIGVKYYKTGTDYIASVMITTAPLNFPSPQTPEYNDGKISCRLVLTDTDLIKRFNGFKIDNTEYKSKINPYGNYEFQVSKKHPTRISALFLAIEKPLLKQESQQVNISKTNKIITVQKPSSNDDKIFYISSGSDFTNTEDKFELIVEKEPAFGCISISWNKIAGAEYYFIYRTPASDSLYIGFEANSLPAFQSQKYDRLRFDNNYHIYTASQKEKLKSQNVYTYWINAKQMYEDLGTSAKISIYYYQGPNGIFSQELKEDSIELKTLEEYQKITSNHKGIGKAFEIKGFEKHVIDYLANADSLGFTYYYIDLKPYRYLESGNDGYINIEDVVRAFLPSEFGNDLDLLVLMTIINHDASAKKQAIMNTKIITDDVIRIPIPQKQIESLD